MGNLYDSSVDGLLFVFVFRRAPPPSPSAPRDPKRIGVSLRFSMFFLVFSFLSSNAPSPAGQARGVAESWAPAAEFEPVTLTRPPPLHPPRAPRRPLNRRARGHADSISLSTSHDVELSSSPAVKRSLGKRARSGFDTPGRPPDFFQHYFPGRKRSRVDEERPFERTFLRKKKNPNIFEYFPLRPWNRQVRHRVINAVLSTLLVV